MALDPILSYSVDVIAGVLTITDSTVYGDGVTDPARSDSLVNFEILYRPCAGDTAISVAYDETDVSSIVFDGLGDGWYQVVMTITEDSGWGGSSFSYSETLNLLVHWDFDTCFDEKLLDYADARCDCGCDMRELLLELDLARKAFIIKFSEQADFSGAQSLLEDAQALCDNFCDC